MLLLFIVVNLRLGIFKNFKVNYYNLLDPDHIYRLISLIKTNLFDRIYFLFTFSIGYVLGVLGFWGFGVLM